MKQSSITVVEYQSQSDFSFLELSMNILKTSFITIQTKITFPTPTLMFCTPFHFAFRGDFKPKYLSFLHLLRYCNL